MAAVTAAAAVVVAVTCISLVDQHTSVNEAALTNCASPGVASAAPAASGGAVPAPSGSASAAPCPSGSAAAASPSASPAGPRVPVKPLDYATGPIAPRQLGDVATNPVDGDGEAISLTQSADQAADSGNCTLSVPPNPLTAKGLATPYQLGDGCTMTNPDEQAFVEATILSPNGQVQVYNPLVVTKGAKPAVKPATPKLPRGARVILDFGFNGTNLLLTGQGAYQKSSGCVDALGQSVIGQVSACNAVPFYNMANSEIARGILRVPNIGRATDGQRCQTTRDFALIDQDPSDNIYSQYLINDQGQTAQATQTNQAKLPGATLLSNGSDNALIGYFVDPANGCKPFTQPDSTSTKGIQSSQALDELSARQNQRGHIAVISTNDEMVLVGGKFSIAKTNMYRSLVDQPQLPESTNPYEVAAAFCMNMVNIAPARNKLDMTPDAAFTTPVPDTGNNLATFLGNRLSMSFDNLGCGDFGLKDPVTVTLDANQVATAVSYDTTQQQATLPASEATVKGSGHKHGRPAEGRRGRRRRPSAPPAEPVGHVASRYLTGLEVDPRWPPAAPSAGPACGPRPDSPRARAVLSVKGCRCWFVPGGGEYRRVAAPAYHGAMTRPPGEAESRPVIVTVDDDPSVSRAVARDLRRRYGQQNRIVRAESGEQALDALRQMKLRGDQVAVILADYRMPGLTGIEFLERAMDVYPYARRVLLTAYADTSAAIDAINVVDLDHYLLKPWDPPEEKLYPVIDELLRAWQRTERRPVHEAKLVGHRWSAPSAEMRDFLARNQVPYRWYASDSAEGGRLLEAADADGHNLPVLITADGEPLVAPSRAEVASKVGLATIPGRGFYDLVVIGGGPAGLGAAVYGASEGLHTVLVEKFATGGQAGQSSRIENYLGFPDGLSGGQLTDRARRQAIKFGAELLTTCEATHLEVNGPARTVHFSDGSAIDAKAVILAMGVSYRQLEAPGCPEMTGAGVYYGAALTEAEACKDQDVYVVGGANSAGQAAVYLARFARSVTLLVRGPSLDQSMSYYLIQQIAGIDNITVRTCTEVVAGARRRAPGAAHAA